MQTEADTQEVARVTARHNFYAGLALVAVAAFFFWKSFSISLDFVDEEGVGPRFFPQALGIALGMIGATLAFLGFRGRTAPTDKSSFSTLRFWQDAVPLFALGLAYIWAFKAFGYVAATLALLAVGLMLFAQRGRALWLMPPLATVALYLVFFRLMRVYEPPAKIFNPLTLLGLI